MSNPKIKTINDSDIFGQKDISIKSIEKNEAGIYGVVTEREKLTAAKQILTGLAVLFAMTIVAYLIQPTQGVILLEICKTVFPPLATLIIAFYFKS